MLKHVSIDLVNKSISLSNKIFYFSVDMVVDEYNVWPIKYYRIKFQSSNFLNSIKVYPKQFPK